MSAKVVKLYYNAVCPFVQRAWIAALEKNAPIELVYVDLPTPDWYAAINPRQTVPTLQHGDKLIFESNLIVEYVDNAFGTPQTLFPGNAVTKHRVRLFIDAVGEFVGAAYTLLRDGKNAEKKKELADNVAYLESLLAKNANAGPFVVADSFSAADIAIVPFLVRFSATLKAYADVDLFAGAPKLRALFEAAHRRPSVASTSLPAASFVKSYADYSAHPALVESKAQIFSWYGCPYAERVRITAALKETPVDIVEVDIKNPPVWYKQFNKYGSVPTLVTSDGTILTESLCIVAYLEDDRKGLGAKLEPDSATDKYDGQFFQEAAGNFRGALMPWLWNKDASKNDALRAEALENAAEVEKLLAAQSPSGPFLFGADPSIYDIGLIPFLLRGAAAAKNDAKFAFLTADKFPRLLALLAGARAHPVISKVIRDEAFYAELVKGH